MNHYWRTAMETFVLISSKSSQWGQLRQKYSRDNGIITAASHTTLQHERTTTRTLGNIWIISFLLVWSEVRITSETSNVFNPWTDLVVLNQSRFSLADFQTVKDVMRKFEVDINKQFCSYIRRQGKKIVFITKIELRECEWM